MDSLDICRCVCVCVSIVCACCKITENSLSTKYLRIFSKILKNSEATFHFYILFFYSKSLMRITAPFCCGVSFITSSTICCINLCHALVLFLLRTAVRVRKKALIKSECFLGSNTIHSIQHVLEFEILNAF